MNNDIQDVLSYIDELNDDELKNLKDQIIRDIDFLKHTNNENQLNFETERLKRISKVLKERDENYKKKNTI